MLNWKGVERQSFSLGADAQEFSFNKRIPLGLMRALWLRLTAADVDADDGALVTNGEKSVLKALTVGSEDHNDIYSNVDGKTLYRLFETLFGYALPASLTEPDAECLFPIMFGLWGVLHHPSKRINDLALWCMASKVYIDGIIGEITKVISGATAPVATVKASLLFEYERRADPRDFDPRGVDANGKSISGDAPMMQPEVSAFDVDTINASGDTEIALQVGQGRRPLYIILSERDTSDVEKSDIVDADTKVTLKYGDTYLVEPGTILKDLDAAVSAHLGRAIPAGYHFIPVILDGKVSDSFETDGIQEFTLTIQDPATVASRKFRVCQFNGKPIRAGALPAAAAAKLARASTSA